MALSGKKELLDIIDKQNDKISKYESKITDLVRACKSLAKEKDALQASFSALAKSSIVSSEDINTSTSKVESSTSNVRNERVTKDARENENTELSALRGQLSTLTATLQTLTEEKNKLELATKSERKRILNEKNQIEEVLQNERAAWSTDKKDYESKLQELRSKVIVLQHERDNESTNGIIMLREVESNISKERKEKERLEKSLYETQEQNRQLALAIGTRSNDNKQQKQIIDLQNELEQVRNRLKKAEEECRNPQALKILQDQMHQMKFQYAKSIHQEQRRAEVAEMNFKSLSQSHEERVAALEDSLSEVSLTAGGWDRKNRNYLETIRSLKEKIGDLSDHNCASQFIEESTEIPFVRENKERVDLESLVEKFTSLWRQIKEIENDAHSNIEDLLLGSEIIHCKCTERLRDCQEKLKRLETKSPRENRDMTRSEESSEKNATMELRERIRSLNAASQMTQRAHDQQVSALKEEMKRVRKEVEERLKVEEHGHRASVAKLEQEIAEHRQRALMTLQDREEEIHRLTNEIFHLNKNAEVRPSSDAVALLSQVNARGGDGPLLHHLEDLARKDQEVSRLRKDKIHLEKAMRDIQMTMIVKQQNMQDLIDDLKEQVQRMERNESREGENLEYLKNVVFQYMTSKDLESRLVILKAVAAVLKFTDEEAESARLAVSLWWWQTPSRNKERHNFRYARKFSTSSDGGSGGGYMA